MKIEQASNRQLTLLRKVQRKKYRRQENLFTVEGERAVQQVIKNGIIDIIDLYFDRDQERWKQAFWSRRADTLPYRAIDTGTFGEISDTDTPQGVLALCKIPPETDVSTLSDETGLVVAVDGIRDPGNLGTIVRTATWFGAAGILVGHGTVDLFHPKVIRGTAGSTGVLPYADGELETLLEKMEGRGWETLLLDVGKGAEELPGISRKGKNILVIGNEAHGISENLCIPGRKRVKIPSGQNRSGVESLNASVAVSIAIYELSEK